MNGNDTRLPRSRAALQQLELALQRLERAASHRGGDLFLADELRTAREAYVRLDQAARVVENRLGEVTDRLRTVLEN